MSDDNDTQLYLIAHKVRGLPAFDVAQRITIGSEEGWIIPTSGHRAYPFWYRHLKQGEWPPQVNDIPDGPLEAYPGFDDLPDHYHATAAPKGQGIYTAEDLISALGLRKPKVTITRRL